ncbi:restriction endonuclease subunit S [Jonquetella anthropi]|uniref:restriction endonuclease subunit S n=1 Tax=Jonquetella anthropi TaxID=428712 RepID=UPI0023F0EDDE|nr:restriction endonuclease subunit S [Jonquetella anthropi]
MQRYAECSPSQAKWLGTLPSHWDCKKIGSLFAERKVKVSDKDYEPLSVTKMGILPQLEDAAKSNDGDNRKLVRAGDFVINSRSDRKGSCGVSELDGSVSLINLTLIPREQWNRRYVHYLLRSQPFSEEYYRNGRGIVADLWTTRYSEMKSILLPVPPRSEQDQIVRFLDWKISSINELINIKHGQLNIVKELLNRVFRDISLEHSKRVKIKYLFGLENDFFVPDASELYSKAGMYNRGRGIFLREQCPGNELGDSQFQHIHPDCLMLSGQFAWEDAVYITQEKDSVGIASHRYYLLKPTKDVSVEYLWAYFLSYEGSFNLQRCSHGSAGRNRPLNIKEVLDLELPVPDDLGAVKTLNKLVRDYMRLQVITRKERTNLIDLRTLLIADTVTGKIDVRNITVPEYEFVDEDVDADKESSEDESEENDDFNGVEE